MKQIAFIKCLLSLTMLIICFPLSSSSYGLLAHEAIIDASWEKSFKPLLKEKYPKSTEVELKKAHAFVYGGAIIPDIGYYPLGSTEFSNLVHYVRSGDFVTMLLEESKSLNEYAFALGVLCHYEADNYGHSLATNKAVAIVFPNLKKKYGKEVTFEQGHNQHSRVEFGFDVLQTARGNYQPNAYHDFIGFQIADTLLERAFLKTYGISLKSIFRSLPAAISVFRFSVKNIIPELTKNAWKIKNSIITKLNPLATKDNYCYSLNKKNYYKEFTRPKIQSIVLSFVIGTLPKIGPLSKFKPKIPNAEAEKLFEQAYDTIVTHYIVTLNNLRSQNVTYRNKDLDTGKESVMGEYKLSDKTYYKLLMKLKRRKFVDTDKSLKKNIAAFYIKQESSQQYAVKSHKGKKITLALKQMNESQASIGVHSK